MHTSPMTLETRFRPGIYWTDDGEARDCILVELVVHGEPVQILEAIDTETGERVLDPQAAIASE